MVEKESTNIFKMESSGFSPCHMGNEIIRQKKRGFECFLTALITTPNLNPRADEISLRVFFDQISFFGRSLLSLSPCTCD